MKITLQNLSKRFNYDWIFRDINYTFESGNAYVITGPNGSGKSTLLKVISGQLSPSEGKLHYAVDNKNIDINDIYKEVVFTAPYIDLIDDFTLTEFLHFHFSFKRTIQQITVDEIISLTGLNKHKNKPLRSFSSGMRQRVKLIAAIVSDTAILLLDEPTTNLDHEGVDWYLEMMEQYRGQRLVIVGSNMEREYAFCMHRINISDYKQ